MNTPFAESVLTSAPQFGAVDSAADALCLGIRRILVPTDFSGASKAAIRYATRFAGHFRAAIHLAYVLDSLSDLKDAELVPGDASAADATLMLQRKLVQLAAEEIGDMIPVFPHVLRGRPFEQIIELAPAYFCDLIIISTHGRTGMNRALLGSVAEQVVRHALCPVLVVRTPERDPALPTETPFTPLTNKANHPKEI